MQRPHATSADAVARVLLANRARFLDFLTRRVGARDLAEEILQDAMVRAVERDGQIRDAENIIAWFFRVLRNAITDVHRRRGAAERALAQFAHDVESRSPSGELDREVCECVSGVLATLKPAHQAPLRAIDLEGGDVGSFAAGAKITPNNAAVRLHRARRALAERLRTTCGACAEHGCLDCTCAHGR